MTTYNISIGTPGILLTQPEMADLETQEWNARKNMSLTDENVLVDPMRLHQFGETVYPKGSRAAKLAAADYLVFSPSGKSDSQYMFAVLRTNVHIS